MLGVAFVDLNNLKYVNDTYGHRQGDMYIYSLCKVFCAHFRNSDIFRIGGDEFVILCCGTPESLFHEKLEEMRKACEEEFPHSIAMGAVWRNETEDVEAMVRKADRLMYADKQRQKVVRGGKLIDWKPLPKDDSLQSCREF